MEKQYNLLTFILIIAIITVCGIPFSYQYGSTELVATLKYMQGDLLFNTNLYGQHILEYKSHIPFFRFSSWFIHFFNIDIAQLDFIYFVVFATVAMAAVFLFLRRLTSKESLSLLIALFFILFNPLRGIYYGYHYKVGLAGTTIGLIAFSVMTLLLYTLFYKKPLWHFIFLILLFAIHPLNALLYLGFVCLYVAIKLITEKENRSKLVLRHAGDMALLISFFVFSYMQFSGASKNDPSKLLTLITMVNHPGAYFFAWMNPAQLFQGVVFFISIFYYFFIGQQKNLFPRAFSHFSIYFSLYALLLCIGNYVAYLFNIELILMMDISRMFALQIPIAFVALAMGIYSRFQQNESKNIALISILLFVCVSYYLITLPVLVLFLIHAKEKNIRYYALPFIITFFITAFSDLNKGLIAFHFWHLSRNPTPLYLAAIGSFFFLGYNFIKKGIRMGLFALFFAGLILAKNYLYNFKTILHDYKAWETDSKELVSYLNNHSKNSDIVWAFDKEFSANGIRPNLVDFISFAYGIYMGNLDQLEAESKLVWGVTLTPDYLQELRKNKTFLEKGLEAYFGEYLENVTADNLQFIRKQYPDFKYILTDAKMNFNHPLPLKLVFSNDIYKLFAFDLIEKQEI